jgi:hypothetical protein
VVGEGAEAGEGFGVHGGRVAEASPLRGEHRRVARAIDGSASRATTASPLRGEHRRDACATKTPPPALRFGTSSLGKRGRMERRAGSPSH